MAARKKKAAPRKHTTAPAPSSVRKKPDKKWKPLHFALLVTSSFLIVALIGLLNHEMWRDEHQAWLVARDAHSLTGVLQNMKYEGNPALWQYLLFFITRFTDNPVVMQALHLLIACGFIFIFNRYAPLKNIYKVLFTFGYFPLYEYTVISRSYGLGILLFFAVCALYKNRNKYYLHIGLLLALLANVSIYTVILAGAIAGILIIDFFLYQSNLNRNPLKLVAGITIFIIGTALSLYQIWPEKDNSFPTPFATQLFDLPRWLSAGSKLFTTYFYIPQPEMNFWNSNIWFSDYITTVEQSFGQWLSENPKYIWGWIIMPLLLLFTSFIIFMRKPLILLLYAGATGGLLSIYYYTNMIHSRYCGFLLIILVAGYWLAEYYPEKKISGGLKGSLSNLGRKISMPFLGIVLFIHVIGAFVAYTMELQYKFSTSKDVAKYIRENKLDMLPIAGITDFIVSPLATYLHTKIYYLQMEDYGSFTIWNLQRNDQMGYADWVQALGRFMDKGHTKILLVKDSAPRITADGKNYMDMERAVIRGNLQLDFLAKFENGIVADEKYYIYLIQKVDPAKVDYSRYIRISE
jgi:hypothetical protein